ncbi:MAG TPA: hypothetical protein VM008_08975 [Phycisphaerae bacterium]|nr:hypothetical protein [Phycisphaerae bacterium]
MIDIAAERLIPIGQIHQFLPSARKGKKIGRATIYRWIATGQLETLKCGGTRFTSLEALQRFATPSAAHSVPSKARHTATSPGCSDHFVDQVMMRLGGRAAGTKSPNKK